MSARCEGLPEEAAAACFALSLGEGNVSAYHLLPDSHLLLPLWRSKDHLAVFGRHEFREKLELEQVSEILTESSNRNYQWKTLHGIKFFLAMVKCSTHNSHLVVCKFRAPQNLCQSVSLWSAADLRQQLRVKQHHKENVNLWTKHLHSPQSSLAVPDFSFNTAARLQNAAKTSRAVTCMYCLCGTCEADKLVSSSSSPPHPQAKQRMWLVGGGMRRCH